MTENEKERQRRRTQRRATKAVAVRRKAGLSDGRLFERNVPEKSYRPYIDYGRRK
jgi:hypothetical protein